MTDHLPSCKLLETTSQLCLHHFRDVSAHLHYTEQKIWKEFNELPELQSLQKKYQMMFADPNVLPKLRGVFDHMIPLIPDYTRVNLRPYMYTLKHRAIIE